MDPHPNNPRTDPPERAGAPEPSIPQPMRGPMPEPMPEPVQAEVRALLRQRAVLADLEKIAAVREKTLRMVHDLRNPLATIQAICGTLILETGDALQRERLEGINHQVDQLARTLEHALGAIPGDAPLDEPPRVPLDLRALARPLIHLLSFQTRDDLRVQLRCEPGLHCRLPEAGLSHSLHHLLRNAVEAASRRTRDRDTPGQVVLACRRDGGRLALHVLDDGPGLPEVLVSGGPRALIASGGGPALGLSSVERFVHSQGGELAFANRARGGAQVCMILPARD